MKIVYLVGVISEDPKSHEWRKEAKHLLKDKFEINDPTSSRFDRELLKEADGDADKMHKLVAEHQAEILLPKSFQSVQAADIILINLDLQAKDRPMVGSIMELAWAFLLHKTVIAIKGDSYYSYHPMVQGCVHAWAKNVTEAAHIIREFFTTER
jgi:nucleoside 2-deoxyribosyltransferase